jgi:hypothetical protein
MIKYLSIIAIVLITLSCGTQKKATTNISPLISYEQLPSLGMTPVYKLHVYADGKIELEAIDQMQLKGKYSSHISKEKLAEIESWFTDADFMNLKDNYDGQIRDVPVHLTTYTKDGETKNIRNRFGAPDALVIIERKLNKLVQNTDWEK